MLEPRAEDAASARLLPRVRESGRRDGYRNTSRERKRKRPCMGAKRTCLLPQLAVPYRMPCHTVPYAVPYRMPYAVPYV